MDPASPTPSNLASLGFSRGLSLLSDGLRSASYVDFDGVNIICPMPWSTLIDLGGYGFQLTYYKEFDYDNKTSFVMVLPVYQFMSQLISLSVNNNCHVKIQKARKKA